MDAMSWTRSEQDHLLQAALEAAERAGEIVRRSYRSEHLEVERKADLSPVTIADREAEAAIREVLHRASPGLGLLGEEFGAEGSQRDFWVIDPIDGTKSFVAGLPYFATLIALVVEGKARLGLAHAPVLGETWWALEGRGAWAGAGTELERGSWSRSRVSEVGELEHAFLSHGGLVHFQEEGLWPALGEIVAVAGRTRGFGDWWGHTLVAQGRCDAMIDPRVAYHDVAAIEVLIEEAGGAFMTAGDRAYGPAYIGPAVSCNRRLSEELRQRLRL